MINVKKAHPDAEIPVKKHEGDAGYDLTTMEDIDLLPMQSVTVSTGLKFQIPKGYYGQICPRSSMAKAGLTIDGGVIDQSYTGECFVILVNRNHEGIMRFKKGSRVCQILFLPAPTTTLREVAEVEVQSTRGQQRFGSTGVYKMTKQKPMKTDEEKTTKEAGKFTYKLGAGLNDNQRGYIHDLMLDYQDVLAIDFEEIKDSKIKFQHVIDTQDHPPKRCAPYRAPMQYRQWMRDEIDSMLKSGIIRPSKSPWASPVVLVPKKTGDPENPFSPRLCIDYRELNRKTKKDAHPIPLIEDILIQMKGKYFSSIDLFSGYHQIPMDPNSIEKTAFVTYEGQWEYTRMPFGLCNAPPTFQRAMNEVFHDMIGHSVFIYLDDITIFTDTFKEHMKVLEEVLKRLRDYGLFVKPKKCTFAAPEIKLLGHIIGRNGISPDPAKVEAVASFPDPTSKTELRAFLGLVNYYRNYIPNCSVIMAHLNYLLREDVPWYWRDKKQAHAAFDQLKACLIDEEHFLIRPDFNKPFLLITDACASGYGAVLAQEVDGKERVISYASKGTTRSESKYGATQLELKAVIWATEHYRHYLEGRKFKVITDHSALKWLLNKKDPKGLYARWLMKLQIYDMDLIIRPGRVHMNADALSRRPPIPPKTDRDITIHVPKQGPVTWDF